MPRRLVLAIALLFGSACAQKPWVAAARSGSLGDLQRYVEVAADRNQFTRARAVELAEEIAEREIEVADDAEVYERIATLGPCASQVFWALKHRAKGKSDGSAAASIVLFEAGYGEGLRAVTPEKESGAWRAFAVRLATAPEQRSFVLRALIDPDVRVRRAALNALQQGPQPSDGSALIDVVRLDPEPALKQAALAVLGDSGNVAALLALREYWDEMAESTRLAFVQALHSPAARTRGGEPLLVRTMESSGSFESLVAASLVFNDVAASRGAAAAHLVRALREGSTSERLLALASLPPNHPEARFEIQKLASSGEPYLRTAALGIYLDQNIALDLVRQRLHTIAASKDADADEAARLLAAHGDVSVLPRIEKELSAPELSARLAAARLLLKLGSWNAVARALTDDHPSVRLSLACDILAK